MPGWTMWPRLDRGVPRRGLLACSYSRLNSEPKGGLALSAKHFDRILTHLFAESESAVKLISHQLLEIFRKRARNLWWDGQLLVFLLPQPSQNVRSTRTEAWSLGAVGASTMQHMIGPEQQRTARHLRLNNFIRARSSILPPFFSERLLRRNTRHASSPKDRRTIRQTESTRPIH